MAEELAHVLECPHRGDNVLAEIWLGNKQRVGRYTQWPNLAGRYDDVDGRPAVADSGSELDTVH